MSLLHVIKYPVTMHFKMGDMKRIPFGILEAWINEIFDEDMYFFYDQEIALQTTGMTRVAYSRVVGEIRRRPYAGDKKRDMERYYDCLGVVLHTVTTHNRAIALRKLKQCLLAAE